jgi:hypothetical protein
MTHVMSWKASIVWCRDQCNVAASEKGCLQIVFSINAERCSRRIAAMTPYRSHFAMLQSCIKWWSEPPIHHLGFATRAAVHTGEQRTSPWVVSCSYAILHGVHNRGTIRALRAGQLSTQGLANLLRCLQAYGHYGC